MSFIILFHWPTIRFLESFLNACASGSLIALNSQAQIHIILVRFPAASMFSHALTLPLDASSINSEKIVDFLELFNSNVNRKPAAGLLPSTYPFVSSKPTLLLQSIESFF